MTLQDELKPHLAAGESVKTAKTRDGDAIVITDRRILNLTREAADSGPTQHAVTSTLFTGDDVAGVSVTEVGDEPIDTERLLLALGVGVAGILGGFVVHDLIPELGVILGGIIAIGCLTIAAGLAYEAFDTEDGHIRVSLDSLSGDTFETLTLTEDDTDVAASISAAVGEAHPS